MNARILRLPDVENTTGLKRSSIYSYIKDGRFPKPVPLGTRAVGWLQSDIENWINQKTEARGATK